MTKNYTTKNSEVLSRIKAQYNAPTYKRAREIANEMQSERAAVEFVVTTHVRKKYRDLYRARLNGESLYVVEIEYHEEALANDTSLSNGNLSQECGGTVDHFDGSTGLFLFEDACAILPHIDRSLVSEIKLVKVCETYVRSVIARRDG